MPQGVRLFAPDGRVFTHSNPIPEFRNLGSREPTLVLISGACTGLPWTYGDTASIAARLSARGRDVVVCELPWFTTNQSDLRSFRWDSLLKEIKGRLVKLLEGRRKLKLVGFSLGAFVAIELAFDSSFAGFGYHLHQPKERLVLFNPPFVFNDPFVRLLERWRLHRGVYRGEPSDDTIKANRWLTLALRLRYLNGLVPTGRDYGKRIRKMPELSDELRIDGPLWYSHWPVSAVAQFLEVVIRVRRQLKKLRCPISLCTSEYDFVVDSDLDCSELLNPQTVSKASIHQFELGGHFALMCRPEVAVELILGS